MNRSKLQVKEDRREVVQEGLHGLKILKHKEASIGKNETCITKKREERKQ